MSEPDIEHQLENAHHELEKRTKERDEARSQLEDSGTHVRKLQSKLAKTLSHSVEVNRHLMLQASRLETRENEVAWRDIHIAAASVELTNLTMELRETNAYLAKRTQQLEAANKELKLLMKQREDFAAALTHDLKSPLIACMRALELFVDGKIAKEQELSIHKQLLESNRSMLRMIWNLLDVYRHDAGHLSTTSEEVVLRELFEHCVADFAIIVEEKQLNIKLDVPCNESLVIFTDRIYLRRVLINLLDNAIKFSPSQGNISVSAFRSEQNIHIVVTDSGPGMSEEQKLHVFERFWQTKHARQRGTGSGLGLYLSRHLITALGGTIECVSEAGIGTQFTIILPRS